jgi:hypothetical protein
MQAWFDRYIQSGVFEEAMIDSIPDDTIETVPRLPPDAPVVESFEEDNVMIRDVIVHHSPDCASQRLVEGACDCEVSRA